MDTYMRSKLYAPNPGDLFVPRQRLFAILDSVNDHKSVFVSAPAGYGKTTLITTWLKERASEYAWVSLDEDDDNPGRLLNYICAAVGRFLPDTFTPSASDPYDLMDKLLYALQECGRECIIVLDDFHFITEPRIIHMLLHFIQYKPPSVSLVIASRGDAPLSFKPALLKQQMVLIKEDLLLFDGEEIRDFFRIRQLNLNPKQTDTLMKRTEGWPCALVALSLSSLTYMYAIPSLEKNEYIQSFLLNEVWRLWDRETQDFLLQTSILNEFSIELAKVVTRMEGAGDILGHIMTNKGFIMTLEGRERWYRCHHVFRDFLRQMLEKDTRFDIKELQRRAAGYYRHSMDIVRAISYYRAAEDCQGILEIIETDSPGLFWSIGAKEIIRMIDGMPEGAFDNLRVCVCYGWALAFAESETKAVPFIEYIKEKLKKNRSSMDQKEVERVRLEINALSFVFNMRAGSHSRMAENLMGIFSRPRLDPILFSPRNILLIYGYQFGYQYTLLNTIFGFFGHIRDYMGFMKKTKYVGYTYMQGPVFRATGAMPVGRAEILYQSDRIDTAMPFLTQGLDESAREGIAHVYLPGMLCLADMQKAEGDVSGAYRTVAECRARLKRLDEISALKIADAYKAGLDLQCDDMGAVSEWERGAQITPYDEIVSFHAIYQYFTLVRVLIKTGRNTLAHLLLHKIKTLLESFPVPNNLIVYFYLDARLAHCEGKNQETRTALLQLLRIGYAHGYLRFFADQGQDMRALLAFGLKERIYEGEDGVPLSYMERLLALTEDYIEKTEAYHKPVHDTDISSITPREREILTCMSQNLTNQQIADQLYISLQTIKNHTSNIYRKLDVTGRMQAVSVAREMGLIP